MLHVRRGDTRHTRSLLRHGAAERFQENTFANDVVALGLGAVVVERKGRDLLGPRRVIGDVQELGAVAVRPEHVQGDEARAGIVAFVAEDPVELDGMSYRLVDLEHHLIRHEHDVEFAARAIRRREETERFLGRATPGPRDSHPDREPLAPLLTETVVAPAPGARLGLSAVEGRDMKARHGEVERLTCFDTVGGQARADRRASSTSSSPSRRCDRRLCRSAISPRRSSMRSAFVNRIGRDTADAIGPGLGDGMTTIVLPSKTLRPLGELCPFPSPPRARRATQHRTASLVAGSSRRRRPESRWPWRRGRRSSAEGSGIVLSNGNVLGDLVDDAKGNVVRGGCKRTEPGRKSGRDQRWGSAVAVARACRKAWHIWDGTGAAARRNGCPSRVPVPASGASEK